MLIKSFKNNVSLFFYSNYKTLNGTTIFYLLPTVEIFLYRIFDNDQGFHVKFEWLFWCFEISKCWGSIYEQ